jgi:hypothetical protein
MSNDHCSGSSPDAGQAENGAPPTARLRNAFAPAWLPGLAVILALLGLYGIWRIQVLYPTQWAWISAQVEVPGSPATTLVRAMQHVSDEHGPKANTRLKLAEFVQNNGRHTQIVLVQGWFFEESIESRDVWKTLGNDVLLVSSVDESLSGHGALSGPITVGCKIKEDEKATQPVGSASIDECHGIYQDKFHINNVARLSAIVGTPSSGWTPCSKFAEHEDQACVSDAIARGLKDIFSQVDTRRSIDAIVFPPIGTGEGKLPKGRFYDILLKDTLIHQLNGGHFLPSTVYLQVQRSEGEPNGSRWPETMSGIAGALAEAVR